MGIWQRIKSRVKKWLGGGSSEKATPPRARAIRSVSRGNTQATGYYRGSRVGSTREEEEKKKKKEAYTKAFKAVKSETKDITEAVKKPPSSELKGKALGVKMANDYKSAAEKNKQKNVIQRKQEIEKNRAKAQKKLDDLKAKREGKVQKERTYTNADGEKVVVRETKSHRAQGKVGGTLASDTAYRMKEMPKTQSFSRGLASGLSFGATELEAKRLAKLNKDRAEAEKTYQKKKSKGAEMAGEIAGSLVSFGATEGATRAIGEKAVSKVAPKAATKLAERKFIQKSAKRAVDKAIKKGASAPKKEIYEELVKQVGKDKAKRVVNNIGSEVAQNLTTSAIYDINRASAEHKVGSKEWWKELGTSAVLNAGVTGAVGGVSALKSGRGLVKESAETVFGKALKPKAGLTSVADGSSAKRAVSAMKRNIPRIGESIEERIARVDAERLVSQNATREPNALDDVIRSIRDDNKPLRERHKDFEERIFKLMDERDGLQGKPASKARIDEIQAEIKTLNDEMTAAERRVADGASAEVKTVGEAKIPAGNEATTKASADEATDSIERIKAEMEEAHRIAKNTSLSSEEREEAAKRFSELNDELRVADSERLVREGGEKADTIRAELNGESNEFAGISDDVSSMGFNAENERVQQASDTLDEALDNANVGKSDFDKLKDKAYKGTGLSTDGKEPMNAGEARQFFDAEWRTTEQHTKRGFSTIAVTGDKGFKGVAYNALKNGETVIDVYHDKENLAKGAQRVMAKADEEGGINQMIKDFEDFAQGKRKLSSNELRDQNYDLIAAVDFANANKDQPWAEKLFLAACDAGAEQSSVSGLSLHMWHELAMSSPAHRAKAVRRQILKMFNRSAGMRKALNKGRNNQIRESELDDILKKNPALQKVLDELDNMDAATSKDEVEKIASRALLHARKAMPMTVLDQLTQWRYVAMLSSPKTHVRNVTSNIYSATLGQVRDAIASSVENNLKKGTGKYGKKFQEAVEAGKINEKNYHKSAGGLSWKAYSDSHAGTKAGFTLNRLNSKIEKARLELDATSVTDTARIERLNNRIKDLEVRQKEAQAAYDKALSKLERGEAKKALESWNSMGKETLVANAEKWERRQYNGTVSKGLFKINDALSNFIGNALETSDALSLERIYREKFDKILTANGWSELSKAAANGDKAAKKSLKELEEYAAQEAAYTAALDTYRNYNALSTAMSRFVNDSLFNYDAPIYKKVLGAGLHAIMPFTKVPVNLVKRGIDYSPVGLMTAKRNLTRAIEAGDITEINRACERLAEGRIGTGVLMLGAGLGFADPDGDLVTGRLHDTDFLDRKKKDAGYQNYSVTLGDKNFTLDWATPTAASMFTGVEFGRMLRHAVDKIGADEGLQFDFWKSFDVPMILASTMIEPTLQLGVFQGINDTLESVVKSDNYDDSGTNINPALKIVSNVASNYVNSQISPAIMGSLSRAFSPYDYFVTGETDAEYAFNQQLAKVPFLSAKNFGAKTNVWGQIKNEKTSKGDYAKSIAKNLLSPANVNKVTWDDTDEWAADFYKRTGYEGAFPKNKYDKNIEVGRIKGAHALEMSNKEIAEYNVQRGRSGSDAIADALNTVVYNRYDKDSKGKRTIAHADNISREERERIAKKFEGKGLKEVVDYIRETPQFKKATVAEQRQVLDAIYGASGSSDDEAKGAKRSAERYIAGKKGISADEYDYYNETPRRVQETLQSAIDAGIITYGQALDFTRNAGKTYYTTDERGEKGGTVVTNYNKKEMMEYLAKMGYSYEQAEVLYNAYKNANAKDFSGIDLSSSSGYRRRYGRRYGGYSRGGGSTKIKAVKKSAFKAKSYKSSYKDIASSLKTRSSSSKSTTPTVKIEPPKVKFKKYEA